MTVERATTVRSRKFWSSRSSRLTALVAAAGLAVAASASAQQAPRTLTIPRDWSPPPPSATSTGGVAPAPIDRDSPPASPRLNGTKIETRGELYHGEPKLTGLDQGASGRRSDLTIEHAVAAKKVDLEDLHRRQLALHDGAMLTTFAESTPSATKDVARDGERPSARSSSSALGYALVGLLALGAAVFQVRRRLRR